MSYIWHAVSSFVNYDEMPLPSPKQEPSSFVCASCKSRIAKGTNLYFMLDCVFCSSTCRLEFMSGSPPDLYVADHFVQALAPKKPSCGSADMTHYSGAGGSGSRQAQVPSTPVAQPVENAVRSSHKRERTEHGGSFFVYLFGS